MRKFVQPESFSPMLNTEWNVSLEPIEVEAQAVRLIAA